MQRVLVIMLFFYPFLATAGDTVLKLYRPYGEVIEQASLSVKTKLSGQCFAQSQLILREDAWRCQVEGKIYDPCFVQAGSKNTQALCPQSPWVGESVQIEVVAPLDNHEHRTLDMASAFPWAVELVNGEHCQAVEADKLYDGMPIRYRCSGQNVLIGYLQRCKAVWSMLEKTPKGVSSVDFSKAWF